MPDNDPTFTYTVDTPPDRCPALFAIAMGCIAVLVAAAIAPAIVIAVWQALL